MPFLNTAAPEEEALKTRVLIAFEDEYRTYREFIANAICTRRPHVKVAVGRLGLLGGEIERFDPHLVICSQPNTVDPNSRPAWVELPLDPDQITGICLNGEYSESTNPTLEEILRVVDETERLLRTEPDPRNC